MKHTESTKPPKTSFQRLTDFTRRIIAVSKSEVRQPQQKPTREKGA